MLRNRIECQLRTPCDPRTAREWAHCIVRHTPGRSPEQIAATTSIPLKRLMKLSAPQAEATARPEEIAAVTKATGRYGWLRFYAHAADCELFPLPTCVAGGVDAEALAQASASLSSLTALVEKLREITDDRLITSPECEEFDEVHGAHVACIARLQAWVHARCEAERRGPEELRKTLAGDRTAPAAARLTAAIGTRAPS